MPRFVAIPILFRREAPVHRLLTPRVSASQGLRMPLVMFSKVADPVKSRVGDTARIGAGPAPVPVPHPPDVHFAVFWNFPIRSATYGIPSARRRIW